VLGNLLNLLFLLSCLLGPFVINLVYTRLGLVVSYKYVESQVRTTQGGIKHVLRERWYAWTEARELYDSGYRPSKDEVLEDEEQYVNDFPMKPDTTSGPKVPTIV